MLLTVFAWAALLLTLTGIYSVLAYLVLQSKHEIGVRIALGAQRAHIHGLILRQTCWMLGIGIMIGSGLAYWPASG
jgi:ABC-type antimicrobial peptide transport system permease subunit